MPGFAFSGPTSEPGWNRYRTARAWAELMRRLGYERYGAHGNDAGAYVSPELGRVAPGARHRRARHPALLVPVRRPGRVRGADRRRSSSTSQFLQTFDDEMSAYAKLQATTPQNLAHALADSPAGQLAWSGAAARRAGQRRLRPHQRVDLLAHQHGRVLGPVLLRGPRTPSTRPSRPPRRPGWPASPTTSRPLRRFAERDHRNIVSWNEYDRGGHWATQDAPTCSSTTSASSSAASAPSRRAVRCECAE